VVRDDGSVRIIIGQEKGKPGVIVEFAAVADYEKCRLEAASSKEQDDDDEQS
jgi:ribosomal protein L24